MTHGLQMLPDLMRELAKHVTEILVERRASLAADLVGEVAGGCTG